MRTFLLGCVLFMLLIVVAMAYVVRRAPDEVGNANDLEDWARGDNARN